LLLEGLVTSAYYVFAYFVSGEIQEQEQDLLCELEGFMASAWAVALMSQLYETPDFLSLLCKCSG
jgi:hypothetical protein